MPYNSGSMSVQPTSTPEERFRSAYWQVFLELDSLRLQQWEQSQLTLPQLRVLFQVRRSPGITTGRLARGMGITVSTTSGLVTKLVERGLVARRSSEEDRRQIPLELSETGRRLAGELAETTRPFLEAVAEELGEDLDRVISALERLVASSTRVRAR
jgi:DNA-binding MarR family transcriptional regulator